MGKMKIRIDKAGMQIYNGNVAENRNPRRIAVFSVVGTLSTIEK